MNESFEFEGKRSGLFWPSFVAAGIMFALGVIINPAWAVFATIPLTLALISHGSGVSPRQLAVTEAGIENQASMTSVSFDDIDGIWCGGVNLLNHQIQPDNQRLLIEHKIGVLEIYDRDLAKLASFTSCLLKSVKPGNNESIRAPFVNQYWLEEKSSFGENLITVCRQAPSFISKRRNRDISGRLAVVAMTVAFILWVVFGFIVESKNDFLIGITAALATLNSIVAFISLIVFLANQKKYSSMAAAALVISPRGFALAQKDLDGSITWNEVKGVKKTRLGLIVSVAGATIVILDIYDLPITHIHRAMKANLA